MFRSVQKGICGAKVVSACGLYVLGCALRSPVIRDTFQESAKLNFRSRFSLCSEDHKNATITSHRHTRVASRDSLC